MTRPAILAAAGAAVLIAAAGQATHLVRTPHRPPIAVVRSGATGAGDEAAHAAVRFAQHLLACPRPPAAGSRRPCGHLEDLQTATQRVDGSAFAVLVTATLLPDAQQLRHVPVPLTLRLLVTSSKHGWTVTCAAA